MQEAEIWEALRKRNPMWVRALTRIRNGEHPSGNRFGNQTLYGRTFFRSKLESLWAKEWDELDLTWVYEPSWARTSEVSYQPDFYLEDINLVVEVKPTLQLAENESKWKVGLSAICRAYEVHGRCVVGPPHDLKNVFHITNEGELEGWHKPGSD